MTKLIKDKCEIDNCMQTEYLHLHHIIERTKKSTNNKNYNLCILCQYHHSMVHDGRLKIISIFPSTKLPNCRTVLYELDGIRNIDIEGPYLEYKNKSYKIKV